MKIEQLKELMGVLLSKGFAVKEHSYLSHQFYEDKGLEILIVGLTDWEDEKKVAEAIKKANIPKENLYIVLRSFDNRIRAFGGRAKIQNKIRYKGWTEEYFDTSRLSCSPFLDILRTLGYDVVNESHPPPQNIETDFQMLPETNRLRRYKHIIYAGPAKLIEKSLHILRDAGIPYTYFNST